MEEHLGRDHPLASRRMLTDGKDLLTREGAELLNVSRAGQMEMDIVSAFLERIELDSTGKLLRLFPFTTSRDASRKSSVSNDCPVRPDGRKHDRSGNDSDSRPSPAEDIEDCG
jgi:hypothetical protein